MNEKITSKEITYSFKVSAELWKRFRIYALQNDASLKALIRFVLEDELREQRFAKK